MKKDYSNKRRESVEKRKIKKNLKSLLKKEKFTERKVD